MVLVPRVCGHQDGKHVTRPGHFSLRVCVLFIGTQFSNLYTTVDTSPSAQAQMTWLRGDHNGWRLTTTAETHGRQMRVYRSICGKTRPCTPQRSPTGVRAHQMGST